jgi:hypothetical protein
MTLPRVQPIAPTWHKEPFDDPDWLFDFKYDGFRALCYLERLVREIDREQFLHVCGFGRNGCEHQECRRVSAEVEVRFLHTLFLSAS